MPQGARIVQAISGEKATMVLVCNKLNCLERQPR